MNTIEFTVWKCLNVICLIACVITGLCCTAKVSVTLNSGHIEVISDVSDRNNTFGQGPNSVCIDFFDLDSSKYHIFNSCGCSEYEISQTINNMHIDVYSILSIIWGTDCCLEDRAPFDKADADMKFSFIYNENGLKGNISIIDNFNLYTIIPQPCMEYVITHPDQSSAVDGEPFYRMILYLIKYYRLIGHSNDELIDFIVKFEKGVERKELILNRDFEFRQIEFMQVCALYKFALTYEDKELGLSELKELGNITSDIINYYNIPTADQIPSIIVYEHRPHSNK